MLVTIIRREIMDYLKSAKFQIGLSVTVILMVVSTSINVRDYVQRQQDYINAMKNPAIDSLYEINIIRPPHLLSTLIQGKDRDLGNRLSMGSGEDIPLKPTGYLSRLAGSHDIFTSGFQALDFAFIVRIILSLMVIFLAYNAVCGEKERGTLRLVLANRLQRNGFLIGKFLGGIIVIIGSFLISSILALIILVINQAVSMTGSDLGRVLGILGLSSIYLVFFFTLGLLISVLVDRPSIALMVLLQIWVFLVILYPHLAVVLTDEFYPIPELQAIENQKEAVSAPYQGELDRLLKGMMDDNTDDAKREEIMNSQYKYNDTKIKVSRIRQGIDQIYSRQLTRQIQMAESIAVLSPAALFDRATERLARTGIPEYERFMEAVKRYVEKRADWDQKNRYKTGNPVEFNYVPEMTAQSFFGTLSSWILLILMSLILFVLAYVCFLRKDVR